MKSCVRFYFRPRTPTQFYAEGVRSQATLDDSDYPGAHCPVPVFLLFDSSEVLTRADCRFSKGNPRLGGTLYSSAKELKALPWNLVYHNTRHDPRRREIPYHKNAEVLIPDMLALDALKYIICRSRAEKDTLLHLLPVAAWEEYHSRTSSTQRISLYFRKHTFVKTVRLSGERCSFEFSSETASPGPFCLHVELLSQAGQLVYHKDEYWTDSRDHQLALKMVRPLGDYDVRLTLDDRLAYAGHYCEEIPF